jgi:hypothetical protein
MGESIRFFYKVTKLVPCYSFQIKNKTFKVYFRLSLVIIGSHFGFFTVFVVSDNFIK